MVAGFAVVGFAVVGFAVVGFAVVGFTAMMSTYVDRRLVSTFVDADFCRAAGA
jgi:hypothetical protein